MKWLKGFIIFLFILILSYVTVSLIAPEKIYSLAINSQRSKAYLIRKEITAGDVKFIYLESNPGSQTAATVVLIHGFGVDKDRWAQMARYMKGYRLIIPDVPGFGESEKNPSLKYDIFSQVNRLDKFTDKLGLKKFYIAGNSMGGYIAGVYAAKYPDKVLGLILMDNAGVVPPVKSTYIKMLEKGTNPLLISDTKDFENMMELVFFKKPFIPFPIKGVMIEKSILNRSFNNKIFNDFISDPAMLERELKIITMPVLIIWGDNDKIIDVSSVQVMEKELKNHTTNILKDCGHVPMMERPEETAGYIASFINSGK